MKTFKLRAIGLFILCLLSLFFIQCDDNDDAAPPPGTSQLTINMSDGPGDYDAVYIEILDIKIKNSSDEGEEGWVSVANPEIVGEGKIYDLLTLTGGVSIVLADTPVTSGHLGQIRLILGDQNTVVVDGVTHTLDTPSAQQSGLKLLVNQNLSSGIEYEFMLDFNVDKSIVSQGNGGYSLKPTIKVSTTANSGAIKGIVTTTLPLSNTLMAAVVGTEISSYVNKDTGAFQLDGVPQGTHSVTFTSSDAAIPPKTISGVSVTNGQITVMDPVTFP